MAMSWSQLPLSIDPVVWQGSLVNITWYGLAFGGGALVASWWFFLLFRKHFSEVLWDDVWDLILCLLVGVLLGARIGFILLYGGSVYWTEPWRIFSPYDFGLGTWTGIRGMSFFGGLLGGSVGVWWWTHRFRKPFFAVTDLLVLAIPIALGFGRLGNFLNNELIGRPTDKPWGMYFTDDPVLLRHPSQLYEAFGEGFVLFLLLRYITRRVTRSGFVTVWFLVLYGTFRFFLEFFRLPDAGSLLFFGTLTFNQVLAAVLVGMGGVLFLTLRGSWYNKNT